MAFHAEAVIADEFMKFVMNGSLYLGSKPVMWSPVEKTALAEAEVEYQDHQSPTIWVKFPVGQRSAPCCADASAQELTQRRACSGLSVVIWTTTPWTIPSNRGVAYLRHDRLRPLPASRGAATDNWAKAGDRLVLADKLAEEVLKAAQASRAPSASATSDAA